MRASGSWGVVVVGLLAGVACKGKDEGPQGGPSGNGSTNGRPERSSYFLTSSSLAKTSAKVIGAQALMLGPGAAKPCKVAETQGLCVTPTQARGKIVNLMLGQGASNPGGPSGGPPTGGGPAGGAPPARLFGSGEGLDRDGKINLAAFDLGAPQAIGGEGNLPDVRPGTSFAQLDTTFGYMDVQLPIDDKFWTLRFAFYPQPIAEDTAVKMCAEANYRQRIAQNGAFVDGAAAFAHGDVLYCEKASASEACAPGDFKWMDAGTGTFTATRPAQPRQIDFVAQNGITCKLHPEGPTAANHHQPGELKFNGFRMSSRLSNPISIWGRYETCNRVFTMKNASGQMVEGTSINATFNYDLDGFVFFPGIGDLASATPAQLLASATLAPLFAREKLGEGPASSEYAGATVTVVLGNEPLAPCGGPDNWDGGGQRPSDAGASPGTGGSNGNGGPSPQDGGMQMMNGPGPSDASDGIHPPTTMPPGCIPDQPVRLTVPGAACTHQACPTPEWMAIPYTPWSSKTRNGGGNCRDYCLQQSCPGEAPQLLTCSPPCQ